MNLDKRFFVVLRSLGTSRKWGSSSDDARLVFIAILGVSDAAGRCRDDPMLIAAEWFAEDMRSRKRKLEDIERSIEELCMRNLVQRYTSVEGDRLLQVPGYPPVGDRSRRLKAIQHPGADGEIEPTWWPRKQKRQSPNGKPSSPKRNGPQSGPRVGGHSVAELTATQLDAVRPSPGGVAHASELSPDSEDLIPPHDTF